MPRLPRPLLALALASLVTVAAAQTPYLVQPGDTLSAIARRYGTSVAELAAANGLSDVNQIRVGQTLTVPTLAALAEPLPAPFVTVDLRPRIATQGRVQSLRVTLAPNATLVAASYLERALPSYRNGAAGSYTLLLVTPVLQPPGRYALSLAATAAGETTRVTVPLEVVAGDYAREEIHLSEETSRLLDPAIVSREHALIETTCSLTGGERRPRGPFRPPVEPLRFTSAFGTLRSYNGGPYRNFHRGLDFGGPEGTPVHAAADGVVALAEALSLYGNTVILSHGLGVCSAYMHLTRSRVSVGDEVEAGEVIGDLGATGLVTGPHLHFEVRVDGVPTAPRQWLEEGVAGD